jgi:hypothetical protein
MAWVSKELKTKIATALKDAKLPFKYTVAGANSSSLVVTITEAPAAFLDDYIGTRADIETGYVQLNTHHLHLYFKGKSLKVVEKLISTIKSSGEWFDKSDSMTDYFHTAFYLDVNIGRYNKPCVFTGKRRKIKAPVEASPTLTKALDILMNQGRENAIPEPSNVVVFPKPDPIVVSPAARDLLMSRVKASMAATPAGAMLSEDALQSLAEAALVGVFEDCAGATA